jgi:hypothetical protein
MTRRAILTGIVLAVLCGASAAVALAIAERGGVRPARSAPLRGTGVTCSLSQLRVGRVVLAPGGGTFGSAAGYLTIRLINDGRTCTIDPSSPFSVTATTDTHSVIRATLTGTKLRLAPRQGVTMTLGTWWRDYPSPTCRGSKVSSVVFHSGGRSKTVGFRRHPYGVCTPLEGSDLLMSRN